MPLIIPKTLPAYDALYNENIFVMHRERALAQHIRPLEILILNLMPTKIHHRDPDRPSVGKYPAAGAHDPAADGQPCGDPRFGGTSRIVL